MWRQFLIFWAKRRNTYCTGKGNERSWICCELDSDKHKCKKQMAQGRWGTHSYCLFSVTSPQGAVQECGHFYLEWDKFQRGLDAQVRHYPWFISWCISPRSGPGNCVKSSHHGNWAGMSQSFIHVLMLSSGDNNLWADYNFISTNWPHCGAQHSIFDMEMRS